jgi:lipopolysaccharide/colanic/teichoic acid biosynthesis glycosyltransferase
MVNLFHNTINSVFDFISVFALLALFSPRIIMTTLVILIVNEERVFFLQPRPGLNAQFLNHKI